jgi:hypothetical protein
MNREKRLVGMVSLGDLSLAADSKAGGALKRISKPAAVPAARPDAGRHAASAHPPA